MVTSSPNVQKICIQLAPSHLSPKGNIPLTLGGRIYLLLSVFNVSEKALMRLISADENFLKAVATPVYYATKQ